MKRRFHILALELPGLSKAPDDPICPHRVIKEPDSCGPRDTKNPGACSNGSMSDFESSRSFWPDAPVARGWRSKDLRLRPDR